MSILTEVLHEVETSFEVDLKSKDRTMKNNLARKAVINALRNNYTTVELGKSIGRKHSTICHYWQTHYQDMNLMFYSDVYKLARNAYKERINVPLITSKDLREAIQEIKIKLSLVEEHLKQL